MTVVGTDENDNTATDEDDAVVTIGPPPPPEIQIVKTAAPGSMIEPGGEFTFSLVISNPGPTAIEITSLNDSVYGNLGDPNNPNVSSNSCDESDRRYAGGRRRQRELFVCRDV